MRLYERATFGKGKVDRATGVFQRVKIINPASKNKRYYPPEVLQKSVGLYENATVNINHARNGEPRTYTDRFGVLKNVRFEEGSLWADLHANPKHPLFESIAWDAENGSPVGLSHDVEAVVKRNVVESISRVLSVDIVHSPATTNSMFESESLIESSDLDSFIDRICTNTEPVQVFSRPSPAVDLNLPPESKADYFPRPLPVLDLSKDN